MEWIIYFFLVIILVVCGEFIFIFLVRNFFYDNKVFLDFKLILILYYCSVFDCVVDCVKNYECKFMMFNVDIYIC